MRVSDSSTPAAFPVSTSAWEAPLSQEPALQDQLDIGPAPRFSAKLMERARANHAKLAAANVARVNEPLALGRAIREHYAKEPLVQVLQNTLHELTEARGLEVGFKFCGPTGLILSQYGFHSAGEEWGDALPLTEAIEVGEGGTCASARAKLDAQLASFAEDPQDTCDTIYLDEGRELPPAPARHGKKHRSRLGKIPFLGRPFR